MYSDCYRIHSHCPRYKGCSPARRPTQCVHCAPLPPAFIVPKLSLFLLTGPESRRKPVEALRRGYRAPVLRERLYSVPSGNELGPEKNRRKGKRPGERSSLWPAKMNFGGGITMGVAGSYAVVLFECLGRYTVLLGVRVSW